MSFARPDELPQRSGSQPPVFPGPPQHQLEQKSDPPGWQAMRAVVSEWSTAERGPSKRSVQGTLALYVPADANRAGTEEAFLIGREFAHHHPESDGGLHMVLPPEWHAAALAKGWAIPHTLAGKPTVSRWTLLVFAPRDAAEREVVRRLIEVSESFARGTA